MPELPIAGRGVPGSKDTAECPAFDGSEKRRGSPCKGTVRVISLPSSRRLLLGHMEPVSSSPSPVPDTEPCLRCPVASKDGI